MASVKQPLLGTNELSLNNSEKSWYSRLLRCAKMYRKELQAHLLNLPSILLLIYTVPLPVCPIMVYDIANDMARPYREHLCTHQYSDSEATAYNPVYILQHVLYLFYPLVGWIADTKIGRGRAVFVGLWVGWTGTLLQSLSSCFQYSSCGVMASVGRYGLSPLALVCLVISVNLFYVILLAYGMDQLIGASSIKVRTFIYWFVWVIFLGGNIPSYVGFLPVTKYHTGMLSMSAIAFGLFTLSLCLHFKFHDRFDNMTISNPYKLVYNVVKFTIRNKYPKNRSALTYWENEVPKRIDFAKNKYGGPYSHEDVESVKTFFRILAVLATLSFFLISLDPFVTGITELVKQFNGGNNGNVQFVTWFIGDNTILIAVPVLQFIILPLFPKLEYFLINSLKGLGLAMICLIFSILSVFLIDLIGRLMTVGPHINCFLTWTAQDPIINISYWVLLIPSILAGAADALSYLCTFEFLCSQAPFGMHGMLIGLFWFLRAICLNISSGITLAFHHGRAINGPSVLSCTTWFALLFGLIAVIGFIMYILVSRWYVLRVRNDDLNLRTIIENHFEQRIMREEEFLNARNAYDDIVTINSNII